MQNAEVLYWPDAVSVVGLSVEITKGSQSLGSSGEVESKYCILEALTHILVHLLLLLITAVLFFRFELACFTNPHSRWTAFVNSREFLLCITIFVIVNFFAFSQLRLFSVCHAQRFFCLVCPFLIFGSMK